jgi:DNA-binding MarR family transcriptional regulator
MDKTRQAALKAAYRQQAPALGIIALQHLPSGRTLLERSPPGALNRHRFELTLGTHRNARLQADWRRDGAAAFRLAIIDTVEVPDDPAFDACRARRPAGPAPRRRWRKGRPCIERACFTLAHSSTAQPTQGKHDRSPSLSPDGAGALDFCLRLARAQALLVRRFDSILGNLHGLSFSDYQLLYHLQRAPGGRLRRTDLAERLALTASGITRSLMPLEKIGLVARQADARDARVGYAAITEAGLALLAFADATAQALAQELLGSASAEQLAPLSLLLGGIAGSQPAHG